MKLTKNQITINIAKLFSQNGIYFVKKNKEGKYSEPKEVSKVIAESITEETFRTMREELLSGHSVFISGFGTFSVKTMKEKKGRNPMTGEELQITKRRKIKFVPATSVKEKLLD